MGRARRAGDRPGERRSAARVVVGRGRGLPVVYLTAWRMLRRAGWTPGRRCSSSASARVCRAGPRDRPRPGSGGRRHQPQRGQAGRAGDGRGAVVDSGGEFPIKADVVFENVGAATWDRSMRALRPGGRLVVAAGLGCQGGALPAPAVLQAARDHRVVDGHLRRVRPGDRAGGRRRRAVDHAIALTSPRPSPPRSRRPARQARPPALSGHRRSPNGSPGPDRSRLTLRRTRSDGVTAGPPGRCSVGSPP